MKVDPNIIGIDYVVLVLFLMCSVGIEYQDRIHPTIIHFSNKKIELNKIILRIVFVILGFMSAFRGMDIANDTLAYYRAYQNIAYNGFAGEARMELGYVGLNVILTYLFKDNLIGFHVLLFITSVFSYLLLEKWIERHANTYGVCILTFYFLINSSFMSAIRQSIAIGFVLWGLMLLEDIKGRKRYITYFIFVVFAMLFHETAVIAFIFPFLKQMAYKRNAILLIILMALLITFTNLVSNIITFLGFGIGYVSTEISNAANVIVMSFMYAALLLLKILYNKNNNEVNKRSKNNTYKDDFYTYCIVLSLAVTIMSLRAPGMSRINIYLLLVGLPYVSNIFNYIKNRRVVFVVKVIFCMAVWSYSLIALVYRPEWQHIWPYHFYW